MRIRFWRTAIVGVLAALGVIGAAAPASAGPCYVVTVYDGSGNPRQVEVCPYD